MKAVDSLDSGPEWKCQLIKVKGDLDNEGKQQSETVEFWYWGILDIIASLLDNSDIAEDIMYTPEKQYTDEIKTKTNRLYSEAMTGDWAWEMQVSLYFVRSRRNTDHTCRRNFHLVQCSVR